MKRVSVLMGIYNCADTLPRALDSLLGQTFKDWICIMCDDGSTDKTYEVAKRYVNDYSNYFVLIQNESNQGLNITLNRCLTLADTEYVARMDGDDISLPYRFEKEIDFLDSHPEFDIVSSPMIQFDDLGDFRTGTAISEPTKKMVVTSSPICHAPMMMRTKALNAVGGYSVNKRVLRVEDVDLWIKLYSNGSKCYNLSEPLYKMQDDRNAASRRKYKYRLNSVRVRLKGCKTMKLSIDCYIKSLKPALIGLIPKPIYLYLHKRKYKTEESL